jgi:hypothetical protein
VNFAKRIKKTSRELCILTNHSDLSQEERNIESTSDDIADGNSFKVTALDEFLLALKLFNLRHYYAYTKHGALIIGKEFI